MTSRPWQRWQDWLPIIVPDRNLLGATVPGSLGGTHNRKRDLQ
jgi:hypothetical protein